MPDETQFPDGNYMCHDCEELFNPDEVPPIGSTYRVATDVWALCPDCAKTQSDGLIRTVARLEKTGRYAWPGGYPLVFFPPDGGCFLCFDCAKETLENDDGPINYAVEDSDSQYYGGIHCDGCNAEIVAAFCPECMDELADKKRLFAENVDASQLCFDCAVALVRRHCRAIKNEPWEHPSDMRGPHARRIPGVGIEILPTKEKEYGWDDGAPWYAKSGTIYRYR